jgi:diketogulonate reductase-like aldo/keto reductase
MRHSQQIEELMKVAKVTPVTNQVESTPFFPQKKLLDVCGKHGITLTAYSPFGGSPQPQPDGTFKDKNVKVALLSHPMVKGLADKYGKTVQQILLKFHTARGVITIPKTVSKERIRTNVNIFDFDLTKEEINSLESLANGERSCIPDILIGHKNYPFVLDE